MESIYHLANGYCYLVSGWKEDNLTEPLLIKCQASLPFMVPILEKHVSLSYRETSTIYFRKTCCEFDRMSNSCKSNQVYPPWSSKRFISVLIQKYQTFILSLHLNIGPPFLFQFSLLRATCFFFSLLRWCWSTFPVGCRRSSCSLLDLLCATFLRIWDNFIGELSNLRLHLQHRTFFFSHYSPNAVLHFNSKQLNLVICPVLLYFILCYFRYC